MWSSVVCVCLELQLDGLITDQAMLVAEYIALEWQLSVQGIILKMLYISIQQHAITHSSKALARTCHLGVCRVHSAGCRCGRSKKTMLCLEDTRGSVNSIALAAT